MRIANLLLILFLLVVAPAHATAGNSNYCSDGANKISFPKAIDNGAWGTSSTTVSADATTAPDGTSTADEIIENSDTGIHAKWQQVVIALGQTNRFSCFVKANTRTRVQLWVNNLNDKSIYDLTDCSVVSSGSTITDRTFATGDGWCYLSATASVDIAGNRHFGVGLVSSGTTTSYTGDNSSSLYAWNCKVETVGGGACITPPARMNILK